MLHCNIHSAWENLPTYFFALVSVKYKPISIIIGRHVIGRNTTKLFHLTCVLTLPWKIWGDRLNRQCSTYMYILMNHWIATNTTGSYCLKNRQRVVSYIIFKLHSRNVRLQRVQRSQMSTNWDDASKTSEQSESRCPLNVWLSTWRQRLCACVHAGGRHFEHIM